MSISFYIDPFTILLLSFVTGFLFYVSSRLNKIEIKIAKFEERLNLFMREFMLELKK